MRYISRSSQFLAAPRYISAAVLSPDLVMECAVEGHGQVSAILEGGSRRGMPGVHLAYVVEPAALGALVCAEPGVGYS